MYLILEVVTGFCLKCPYRFCLVLSGCLSLSQRVSNHGDKFAKLLNFGDSMIKIKISVSHLMLFD